MKKSIILIVSLLLSLYCCPDILAQNNKTENRVKEIRKIYSNTQEHIKHSLELEETNNSMKIDMSRMFGGSGMQQKKMEFYYNVDDSRTNGVGWNLYFVRVSYNYAVRQFYEEYLFDEETGKIMFIYKKADSYDNNVMYNEERCYFYPDGTLCTYKHQHKDSQGKTIIDNKHYSNKSAEVIDLIKSAKQIKTIYNTTVQSE